MYIPRVFLLEWDVYVFENTYFRLMFLLLYPGVKIIYCFAPPPLETRIQRLQRLQCSLREACYIIMHH